MKKPNAAQIRFASRRAQGLPRPKSSLQKRREEYNRSIPVGSDEAPLIFAIGGSTPRIVPAQPSRRELRERA